MCRKLVTRVVRFSDGYFFRGVKGKQVRKTHQFKDSKIITGGKLSDRDKRYLEKYDYELIKVEFCMRILD